MNPTEKKSYLFSKLYMGIRTLFSWDKDYVIKKYIHSLKRLYW